MTTEAEYRVRLAGLLDGVGLRQDWRPSVGAILDDGDLTSSLEISLIIELGVRSGYLALADLEGHWSKRYLALTLAPRDYSIVQSFNARESLLMFNRESERIREATIPVDGSLGDVRFASFLNLVLDDLAQEFSLRTIARNNRYFPFDISDLVFDLDLRLEDQEAIHEEHSKFMYGVVRGTIDYGQFFEPLSSHLRIEYAIPISNWLLPLIGYEFNGREWILNSRRQIWIRSTPSFVRRNEERWDNVPHEFHAAWKTLREVAALLVASPGLLNSA